MSDFENDAPEDLSSGLAAQLTDSVGVPDDADENTAVPNAVADELELYQEHADRRDEHLAEQSDDDGEQVGQQPADKGRKQHVPLGALQEERQKRQAIAAEAEQLRQQLAAHQQQLAQFQAWQAQQQQAAQQATLPEFADDPEGHVKGLVEQFQRELADLRGAGQQRNEYEQGVAELHRQSAELAPQVVATEQEFRRHHPDYDAAHDFVQQGILEQLAAQHPGATPEHLQLIQSAALLQFVKQCSATGVNPCEHVYQRAKQLGFQTQARTPAKRAPTSLSNLPGDGKAPDQQGALNARSIAAMTNEEFDAMFEQMRAGSVQQPWG